MGFFLFCIVFVFVFCFVFIVNLSLASLRFLVSLCRQFGPMVEILSVVQYKKVWFQPFQMYISYIW